MQVANKQMLQHVVDKKLDSHPTVALPGDSDLQEGRR